MVEVAENARQRDAHLVPSAQYNIGRAYFQGFGVGQSDEEAVRWWVSSAEKGKDPSSVRAQNTLGMYYSRQENINLKEARAPRGGGGVGCKGVYTDLISLFPSTL